MSYSGSTIVVPTVPPPTSGWSFTNQSSAVATQFADNAINLWVPKNASGDNMVGYFQTPPSTPYTVIAKFNWNAAGGVINNRGDALHVGGIGFSDGAGVLFLNTRFSSTNTASWSILWCASFSTASANAGNNFQDASGFPWNNINWLMLRNDGTNIKFYIGDASGKNFELVYSEAKGAHLGTINAVGLVTDTAGVADLNLTLDSWQVVGV